MDGFVSRLMDSEWMDRLLSKLMGGIVDCWMSRMVDEWIDRMSVSLISVSLISSHLSLSIFPTTTISCLSHGRWWYLLILFIFEVQGYGGCFVKSQM